MYVCLNNELNSYVELKQKLSGYFDNHKVAIQVIISMYKYRNGYLVIINYNGKNVFLL